MTLLTLNVLALTIFSDGLSSDVDEFRLAVSAYFATIGRIGALDLFGVPDVVPRPGRKRLKQTMSYFEGVIDDIIAARQANCARTGTGPPQNSSTSCVPPRSSQGARSSGPPSPCRGR